MSNDDDPEIEVSPLSGTVSRDGIVVSVEIYRLVGEPAWALEVIDQGGGSTVWDELFESDADALNEFNQVLEADGIQSFAEAPVGRQ